MPSSPSKSVVPIERDVSVRHLLLPLADLLARPEVTDIAINEPGLVHVETPSGWHAIERPELTFGALQSLATAVGALSSQHLTRERPILSASLPAGERIQIVVPPAVPAQTVSITIRRPSAQAPSIDNFAGLFESTRVDASAPASVDAQLRELLGQREFIAFWRLAVRSRKNIAIVGDTGSGKTTFQKALCAMIPAHERVVTLEDTRELQMSGHPNKVHLLYSKGGQGVASVTPADLIASTMRMKPDRVLLAELRGSEAYDFLKLLTTGHAGSMTSFHAASAGVALERFALMAKEHPEAASYDDNALRRLLAMTVDIVAHISAERALVDGQAVVRRRMTEILFLREGS